MLAIFLSYARSDGSGAALQLRQELEQVGFTIWRDIEDMRGGQAWKEQLRAALNQVDVVLVLLTPGSVKSKNVAWEWDSAITLRKHIIPLLIAPCTVPAELASLQYHDLGQPDKYTLGLLRLIRDLNTIAVSSTEAVQPDIKAPKYAVYGPTINTAIGDHATVYKGLTNDNVVQLFKLMQTATQIDPNIASQDRPEVRQALSMVKAEAIKGDNADASVMESQMRKLQRMAPDILEVILATAANPLAGFGVVATKVAQRIKEEADKENPH